MSNSAELLMRMFRAVEQRDAEELFRLYHPEIEFHEPSSLPFGGSYRGREAVMEHASAWRRTWEPLQTEAERGMEPRIVATADGVVVALWRQKALSPTGERLDSPVLALYRFRDGRLVYAQMFHFDTVAVASFVRSASCADG
jgi:ketosteroid isomerase-like protein